MAMSTESLSRLGKVAMKAAWTPKLDIERYKIAPLELAPPLLDGFEVSRLGFFFKLQENRPRRAVLHRCRQPA
jgi:hypothetical protein